MGSSKSVSIFHMSIDNCYWCNYDGYISRKNIPLL